jgi:septum formation protein
MRVGDKTMDEDLGMSDAPQLILASASARRRELLRQIGVGFEVQVVEVDEAYRKDEDPQAHVLRLAGAKARAAAARAGYRLPVLGADTVVVVADRLLGKPAGRDEALSMLDALSGRIHRVMTGVVVVAEGVESARLSVSRVGFRTTTPVERESYWASGECVDKAGAYAIQGKGALFVRHLEGSFSGVVGLPLFETAELLAAVGIDPLSCPDTRGMSS